MPLRSLGKHAALLEDSARQSLSLSSKECVIASYSTPHLLEELQALMASDLQPLPGTTDLGRQKGIWQSDFDGFSWVKTVVHHLVGK